MADPDIALTHPVPPCPCPLLKSGRSGEEEGRKRKRECCEA